MCKTSPEPAAVPEIRDHFTWKRLPQPKWDSLHPNKENNCNGSKYMNQVQIQEVILTLQNIPYFSPLEDSETFAHCLPISPVL